MWYRNIRENCANNCACGLGADSCDGVSGCVCNYGWIGSRCDQDVDECQTLSVVQECQNKNAKCINFPGNYSSTVRLAINRIPAICADTDECLDFPCSQTCENFPGGYRCLCNRGFTLDNEGNCKGTTNLRRSFGAFSVVADEDECALPTTNRCQQQCINTIGSYFCHCNQSGYELDNDGFSCTARVKCGNNTCPSLNGGCSVVNGTDTCFCNSGYYYNQTINNCTQQVLNWCQLADCQYNCSEIQELPRFQCQCPDGYLLNDDKKTCRMCAAGNYGQNCSSNCTCDAQNTVNCSNVDGTCTCKTGWNGTNCDIDIDECAQSLPTSCVANSTCSNTNGSYLCVCNTGYQKLTDGNCTECTNNTYGQNCSHQCQCNLDNTVSCDHVSGNCTCKLEWEGATCDTDIDECVTNTHNCSEQKEICNNTVGGYDCTCKDGYHKDSYGICEQCANNTFGTNCSHQCQCNFTNTDSCDHVSGNCTCKLEWEGPTCETDIDECVTNTHNCSEQKEICNNTVGGYDCTCKWLSQGFYGICEQCTNNTYGQNCSHQCQCNLDNFVSCDHVSGNCTCKLEWEGPTCETDIDECTTNTYNCSDPHETCNNTVGGYDCLCVDGYQKDSSGICEQCANNTFGTNCSHQCQCNFTNTDSCDHVSGNCTCKLEWEGPTCDTDIDECVTNTHNCSEQKEICNNTVGGFDCTCKDGYHKDSYGICEQCTNNTYGQNCSHQCQCNLDNFVSCDHVSGNCTCNIKWEGPTCETDIDECTTNTYNCSDPHETCNNTVGGYDCICVDGYQKDSSGICKPCASGNFGTNCSSDCTCAAENTVNCSNVDGTCTCKSGWNGANCDQDIDECGQSPPPSCVANSTCSNTDGSYMCVCNPGFQLLPDETCTELAQIPLALTLNGSLRYSEEELENKSSDAFQNMSAEIIREYKLTVFYLFSSLDSGDVSAFTYPVCRI
ncbi:hypothetical protein C0Q70_02874 [Pomacea canaliculata]|uniref:EGF-like domain-containing protein n=1 Tax=Pomacea canaliculata TaxID=400727 RepID=A0A2T7PR62_POMCA|nr:hypothetical protein C0Q70_02874 [Pomacea canaliculata]